MTGWQAEMESGRGCGRNSDKLKLERRGKKKSCINADEAKWMTGLTNSPYAQGHGSSGSGL